MTYTVVKPTKSVGIGIILAFFLGPIGLFYSSITGGLLMTFLPMAGLFIVGIMPHTQLANLIADLIVVWIIFGWLICMLWAVIGVIRYNRRLIRFASVSEIEDSFDSTTYYEEPSSNNRVIKVLIALLTICIIGWFVYKISNTSRDSANNKISNPTWTAETTVDLYSSPNIKSKIVGYISSGASLTALKQTNYFINVEFTDAKGKLRKGYVQKSKLKEMLIED